MDEHGPVGWRFWHRTGHRWIEKCNMNVLTAIRERVLCWTGHVARMDYSEICANSLRCRGRQWWRWRQLHLKEVDRETRGLVCSQNDSTFTDGRTWCRQTSPSFLEMQTASRNHRGRWRQFSKFAIKPSAGVANEGTQWRYTSCLGGPSAPGELVGSSLLVALNGVEWGLVAPSGFDWRRMVDTSGTK